MTTLNQVLEMALQLPYEQQEMLIQILRNRHHESRRAEVATDVRQTLADFRAGKFQPQSAEDVIAALRQSLVKTSPQAYRLELMPPCDFEFLYDLCRSTMERYVIAAWGEWCDEIVRSQLLDGLKGNAFDSIFIDSPKESLRQRMRVGAIALERHDTHIQIEDLYILEEFQNQGIGTSIILDIIAEAHQSNKPVRLRVLSSSPAKILYERLGFVVVQTTPERYFMEFI